MGRQRQECANSGHSSRGPKANGLVSLHSSLPTSRSAARCARGVGPKRHLLWRTSPSETPPGLAYFGHCPYQYNRTDKWGWLAKPVSPRRSGFDPRLYGRTACPGITTRSFTTRCGPGSSARAGFRAADRPRHHAQADRGRAVRWREIRRRRPFSCRSTHVDRFDQRRHPAPGRRDRWLRARGPLSGRPCLAAGRRRFSDGFAGRARQICLYGRKGLPHCPAAE